MRQQHLDQDLQKSHYTIDLFKQYKKHLGPVRFQLLKEGQILVVPERARALLGLRSKSALTPILSIYKLTRLVKADWFLKSIILPANYKEQIKNLDQVPS
jgi:hypothetical protein